jgi:V/A-type H+-transporting ATPase subunit I
MAITFGFLHMGIGLSMGVVNEVRHNPRHAVAKAGWILVLIALFAVIGALAAGAHTHIGEFLNDWIFFGQLTVGSMVQGLFVPTLTWILLVPGMIMLVIGEGPMSIMEIMGLVSNMISYSRLAAIAIADASTALAINTIILPVLWEAGTGAPGAIAAAMVGVIIMFIAHAFFTVLGTLSISIQAIRLNLVEFFLKFYKGGGTEFKPFGPKRTHTAPGPGASGGTRTTSRWDRT